MIETDILQKKIPKTGTPELWEKQKFIDSPFVEIPSSIKIGDEVKIVTDLQYPKLGMKYALKRCLIRKEALEKLLSACIKLPKGLAFKIFDIYRPWDLQNELYYEYRPKIIRQFGLEDLSIQEQEKIINTYIAIPSKDRNLPPQHSTGGAIDLTITDIENNVDLDFGVGFDEFTDLTNTDAFENNDSQTEIRKNRRLLYNVMTQAGFTNLPSEIWHFDYGDKNWGYYNKKPAIYKGAFSIDEIDKIISFEEFMCN